MKTTKKLTAEKISCEGAALLAYAHAMKECAKQMEKTGRARVPSERMLEFIEAKASIENFIHDIVDQLK